MADNGTNRQYLVMARVGDRSLHTEWIHPAEDRNFDLALSYYGDTPGRYAQECEFYTETKGSKWPKIYEWIESMGERIFEYDAVWFPDDDISTDPGNISHMFRLFQEHGLLLAQPALTANHYFKVTKLHKNYRLRYTNFVEIMVPVFSRDALKACWHTFDKSVTGWGMEHVWAKLLDYPYKKMAILDETPVRHTRPPGKGDLYENIKNQMKINIWSPKERNVWKEYGIVAPKPSEIGFYDGITTGVPFRKKLVKRKPPALKKPALKKKKKGILLRRKRIIKKRSKKRVSVKR